MKMTERRVYTDGQIDFDTDQLRVKVTVYETVNLKRLGKGIILHVPWSLLQEFREGEFLSNYRITPERLGEEPTGELPWESPERMAPPPLYKLIEGGSK